MAMNSDAPIPVRRAGAGDVAACARIVSNWARTTPWIAERFSEAELTEMIGQGLKIREIYVAGDPVVGYMSFNPEKDHLVALYTDQPGRGVGKALMDHLKSGRSYLQLWTHEPNTAAHRFYEREGFVQVERNPMGDDGLPEIRMEWRR